MGLEVLGVSGGRAAQNSSGSFAVAGPVSELKGQKHQAHRGLGVEPCVIVRQPAIFGDGARVLPSDPGAQSVTPGVGIGPARRRHQPPPVGLGPFG
jgi:hypothetical protein